MELVIHRRSSVLFVGVALLFAVPFGVTAASSGHGSLDPSFGKGGIVTTAIGDGASASALVIQPDSKLIAAGASLLPSGNSYASTLARYNPNGSLDRRFGSAGVVRTPAGGVSALAIQLDGKLVAAGSGFSLVRYKPNGTLDRSFGSRGQVVTVFGSIGEDSANALVIQPDGKLVAAGSAGYKYGEAGSVFSHFALARYNRNGSLDRSFGRGGKVVTKISSDDVAYGLVLQPDGSTDFGSEFDEAAIVIQKDGKLVALGAGLARFNVDGSLDRRFGSGGKVTETTGFTLVVQPDGRVVTAGVGQDPSVSDFVLARYTANGTLDRSFGSGGKVTTVFGEGLGAARALAIQEDGKLVAAGYSRTPATADSRFVLARYLR
jgi:uncharacterized delta-60 repeat protein